MECLYHTWWERILTVLEQLISSMVLVHACRLVIVLNDDALDNYIYGLKAVIKPNISMTIVNLD